MGGAYPQVWGWKRRGHCLRNIKGVAATPLYPSHIWVYADLWRSQQRNSWLGSLSRGLPIRSVVWCALWQVTRCMMTDIGLSRLDPHCIGSLGFMFLAT